MTEGIFWQIVALLDWEDTGDDDRVLRPAVVALSRMSVDDIFAFDDLLAEKLFALDTREVCRQVYTGEIDPDDGEQYVSPDDFLYSRCVIVANGREYYDSVLRDPENAPQDMEFEALLYLAQTAYEEKTGKEYDHATRVSWESFSNHEGWKPSPNTIPGTFTDEKIPPGNRRRG